MRLLTLDAWVRFVGAEVDGNGGELARSAAAGVGEDADGLLDARLPSSIPCTEMKRTKRRRG